MFRYNFKDALFYEKRIESHKILNKEHRFIHPYDRETNFPFSKYHNLLTYSYKTLLYFFIFLKQLNLLEFEP